MDITWLGHACFRLRADDTVVVTDPFPLSLGLRPDGRPATVVTISNSHPNHSNWVEVAGDPRVFKAPGEYEYRSISVRGIMTPQPPGSNPELRSVDKNGRTTPRLSYAYPQVRGFVISLLREIKLFYAYDVFHRCITAYLLS